MLDNSVTILKKFIFWILVPIFSFSQDWEYQENIWNKRSNNVSIYRGTSIGFLFSGQNRYPQEYYGPEVQGLFNDGAYGIFIDVYVKKFILGFQLSDEYYFIAYEDDNGSIWKPRGFNGSFSSNTRSYWLTTGYAIWKQLYIKVNAGLRSGPVSAIFFKEVTAQEVADGFDFDSPFNYYNLKANELPNFSELDFSFTINYPVDVFNRWALVPEIGYSINYGGIMLGCGIKYKAAKDAD